MTGADLWGVRGLRPPYLYQVHGSPLSLKFAAMVEREEGKMVHKIV